MTLPVDLQSSPSDSPYSPVLATPGPQSAAASENGPQSQARLPKNLAWLALVFFLVVSTWITWYGRNQRSGRNRETFPGDRSYCLFPLLGQCILQGQDPFFYEDRSLMEQVAFFSGWREAQLDRFCFRPLTAFFATLLTPAVGTIGAALLVNWLAWALCAWAAWRLSKRLFNDDLAALFAVVFVSGGMGIVFHIGDYSAHVPGFAAYYLGVYLLYDSGIPSGRRPWRSHLLVGTFLALACLTYSWYGLLLIAVYTLCAMRHNCWYHVAVAVVLALTASPLWGVTLRRLGVEAPAQELGEARLSINLWLQLLEQPVPEIARVLAKRLGSIGLFDSPVVMVLGVLSCLSLRGNPDLRWFGVLVLTIPVLAVFVTLACPDMRGYLTYGVSLWIYCCLGRFLVAGFRGRPRLRAATGLVLSVVVFTQFAWSTAHFWSWLGPVKAFISGWDHARPYFMHGRPIILSMTGMERTPVLFGGDASLAAAGAYVTDPQVVLEPGSLSWRRALAARAPFFGYLALFGMVAARSPRRRVLVATVMACLAVASTGLSPLTLRTIPNRVETFWYTPLSLPPEAKLTYRVELSRSFLDTLRKAMEPVDQLQFFVGIPSVYHYGMSMGDSEERSMVEVSVAADSASIPVRNSWRCVRSPGSANPTFRAVDGACRALDPQAALARLIEAGHVTLEVTNHLKQPVMLAVWQRQGLPGRQLVISSAEGGEVEMWGCLPAVEVRVLRPDGSIKVAGF